MKNLRLARFVLLVFAIAAAATAGCSNKEKSSVKVRRVEGVAKDINLQTGEVSMTVVREDGKENELKGRTDDTTEISINGRVQALSDVLQQLGTDEVQVDIIHRSVGAINEEDVLLAGTGRAVIVGFRVRPTPTARQMAEKDGIDYRFYDVIYDAVDEIKGALEGMLTPDRRETVHGAAEVREIFKIRKVGTIAGCSVVDGLINRKGNARLIRDGVVVYDGELSSLKRFKDEAKEVREGFECGIGIANYNDIKVGDIIECYTVEEIARTLA